MAVKVKRQDVEHLLPRKRTKKAKEPLAEGGTVICEGTVFGRPVSWKAPRNSRTGGVIPTRQYKAYKEWQATVREQAAKDMGRKTPYAGPVELYLDFYLAPNGKTRPDTSNLVKSTEDSLQGVVIRNDIEVVAVHARRIVTDQEVQRVEYRVVAVNP